MNNNNISTMKNNIINFSKNSCGCARPAYQSKTKARKILGIFYCKYYKFSDQAMHPALIVDYFISAFSPRMYCPCMWSPLTV